MNKVKSISSALELLVSLLNLILGVILLWIALYLSSMFEGVIGPIGGADPGIFGTLFILIQLDLVGLFVLNTFSTSYYLYQIP
jgi:hypothetical protein